MADEYGSGGGGGFDSWSADSWQPPSWGGEIPGVGPGAWSGSDGGGGGGMSPSAAGPDWSNFSYVPPSNEGYGPGPSWQSAVLPTMPAWQSQPPGQAQLPVPQQPQAPSSISMFSRAPSFVSSAADWLSRQVTGQTPMEMAQAVRQNPTNSPQVSQIQRTYSDMDKQLHAYASMLMAERFGRWPAWAVGVGKEALDFPFGQAEYGDLVANMTGLNLARPR